MITQEQQKEVRDRVEALNRYLNIPEKRIQLEEEQLRTQAPGFWDDQKKAEAQMKLVKGIEKWIKDFEAVSAQADELELAVDFFKEGLVTEAEVDENYQKAISSIEALELRNMLWTPCSKSTPVPAARRLRTGRSNSCVCICVGQKKTNTNAV